MPQRCDPQWRGSGLNHPIRPQHTLRIHLHLHRGVPDPEVVLQIVRQCVQEPVQVLSGDRKEEAA